MDRPKYTFGPRAGLTYSFTDKFSIEGTYYFGTTNILKYVGDSDWAWKTQQATVGLKYNFLK